MPRHFQPFVKPLLPQTAPVPISDRHVAQKPWQAVPPRFAQGDTFTAQVRPTLATLAISAAFLAFVPPNAQPQKFAPCDVVNQVRPTLATLPSGTATDFAPRTGQSQPPRFSAAEPFSAPPKFNLTAAATVTISAWSPTPGAEVITLVFHQDNVVAPPIAPFVSPFTSSSWRQPDPLPFVEPTFKWADLIVAPPSAPFVSPFSIDSWLPTIGQPAIKLAYRSDIVTQGPTAPLVSPFTFSNWRQPDPLPSVPPRYMSGDVYTAPAKNLPPAPITLNHWTPTIGANAVVLLYAQTAPFAVPDKFNIVTPAATFLPAWTSTIGSNAQPQQFTDPNFVVPANAPAISITINGWQTTDGQRAQPNDFAATLSISPDKTVAVPPAAATIAGWLPTLGQKSLPSPLWGGFAISPVFTPTLIGPFVLTAVLRHRTYSQLTATHQTYSQLIALGGIRIVGLT
jgi:hypothetical protein